MTRKLALAVLAPALLLLTGACATATDPAAVAAAATPTTSSVTLTASDGRKVDVTVIAPPAPRGVILFSHGGGSSPSATPGLHARLAALGFVVLSPTHTDSLTLPSERRTDIRAAFPTRIGDMLATSGYAAQAFPGLPLAQVGYSYGSLTSLIGGGAFAKIMPGSIPGAKAVVMFSSPGPIAPLTSMPGAFDAVTIPTLLITGDADTVPGIVSDPAQHLLYFDKLPAGDHTALIVTGATHEFIRGNQPGWNEVSPMVDDFLLGRVLGETAAGAHFDRAASSATVAVRRR